MYRHAKLSASHRLRASSWMNVDCRGGNPGKEEKGNCYITVNSNLAARIISFDPRRELRDQ